MNKNPMQKAGPKAHSHGHSIRRAATATRAYLADPLENANDTDQSYIGHVNCIQPLSEGDTSQDGDPPSNEVDVLLVIPHPSPSEGKGTNVNDANSAARMLLSDFVSEASDIELQQLRHLQVRLEFRRRGSYPRWGHADLPDPLKQLTSPLFLKKVYASLFVNDVIDKGAVREFDSDLMGDVEQYINKRTTRKSSGPGDADGLQFLPVPGKRRGRKGADERLAATGPTEPVQDAAEAEPHRPRRKTGGSRPSP